MVKSINVAVDDELHEQANEIKEELGLTWEEFIEEGTDCLRENRV